MAKWGTRGRLICHAGFQALAILALAVAMIPTPCVTETLFIPTISFMALMATGFFAAGVAAVAVPSVAVATPVSFGLPR